MHDSRLNSRQADASTLTDLASLNSRGVNVDIIISLKLANVRQLIEGMKLVRRNTCFHPKYFFLILSTRVVHVILRMILSLFLSCSD